MKPCFDIDVKLGTGKYLGDAIFVLNFFNIFNWSDVDIDGNDFDYKLRQIFADIFFKENIP